MPAEKAKLRNGAQEFIERIQRNKYDPNKWGGRSDAFLMREQFRRRVLWCEALNDWWSFPWHDLVDVINPALQLTTAERLALDTICDKPRFFLHSESFEWIMKWHILRQDTNHSHLLPDLPDPWEPILRLRERGGSYWKENFWVCGLSGMIPILGWKERAETIEPLTDLSDGAMENINKAIDDGTIINWYDSVAHL